MRLHYCFLFLAFAAGFAQAQTPPTSADVDQFGPLHLAAHTGDVAALRNLLSEGAEINARDRMARTAAHVAAFASQDEALRVLADAGIAMNALDAEAYDIVTIAAVLDDPELMSLAIHLGNDPGLTTSRWDGTALIAAAHLGHAEVVRRLIAAGAPLDHVNNLGWTALLEAVILGDGGTDHQEVVRALIEAGADAAIADRDGLTPLEHARARGYTVLIRLLGG